ncbi:MAG: alpha/beta hydrolase [Burkholderiales bacterium]|nr:alpha/beta hydrolase [Burkholderiales bacterium]
MSEEIERGYNNRAAVPDHPRIIAQWAQLSEAARATYAPKRDLRYGPNPREVLDLFLPEGAPRGIFVFLHGGYWRALSKDEHSFVAAPFVDQGLAVAVVGYDLCPAVRVATIVDECRRALAWIGDHGPRHGAPGGQVVIGGHSAGGHLAAMMFGADWAGKAPLRAGVTLSGVHDLAPIVDVSFNADIRLDRDEARRMSPVRHPPRTDAPLLVACGAAETGEFRRQSQLLWDAWPRNRRPADGPLFVPGKNHFDVLLEYADPDSALTRATLALF